MYVYTYIYIYLFCIFGGEIAEVEQGKAEGEGEQHGAVRPGDLRQAPLRGPQIQAHHSLYSLRSYEGNVSSIRFLFNFDFVFLFLSFV